MPEEKIDQMVPELLITYGGHVVSKRLKKFLRQHPPKEHWHVSPDGEVVDLYGSLTTVIEMDRSSFWRRSPACWITGLLTIPVYGRIIVRLFPNRSLLIRKCCCRYIIESFAGVLRIASGKQFGSSLCTTIFDPFHD